MPPKVSQQQLVQSQHQQARHQHYTMKICDKDILLSKTTWVTDTIIDAAQSILNDMTPTNGFQPVSLGHMLMIEIQTDKFVQILYCHSGYWITVRTIGAQDPTEVFIYDSLYPCASTNVKWQIAVY